MSSDGCSTRDSVTKKECSVSMTKTADCGAEWGSGPDGYLDSRDLDAARVFGLLLQDG